MRQKTIGEQMLWLGTAIVLILILFAGGTLITNFKVQRDFSRLKPRYQQITMVDAMVRARLHLVLAAMDSIVDKEEGKISPKRLHEINTKTAYIQNHLGDLAQLADTAEEKRLAPGIAGRFNALGAVIQKDLPQLIETRAGAVEARRTGLPPASRFAGLGKAFIPARKALPPVAKKNSKFPEQGGRVG